jgi:hypothetical protein
MRKILFASLLLLCGVSQAHSQYQSGNNLHADMNASNISTRMFAFGYVIGVVDTVIGKQLCISRDVTQGQLEEVVKIFLDSRPQVRHLPADVIVIVALEQYWPCKERKKS